MIGAPWIYSEDLEPRVLAVLSQLADVRSLLTEPPREGEPIPSERERSEAHARVRELKDKLRDLVG